MNINSKLKPRSDHDQDAQKCPHIAEKFALPNRTEVGRTPFAILLHFAVSLTTDSIGKTR
jgi:hypothetical protein